MKSYYSIEAFAKNKDLNFCKENYYPFYQGYQEICKIDGIVCFAIVVLFDDENNILEPSQVSKVSRYEYMFRFDPSTDKQYERYNTICNKYKNPEWITLS